MTKRRAKGEGSVYLRASDGLWLAALDLGMHEGKRVRRTFTGRTRVEAMAKLRRARTAHEAGMPVPDDKVRVRDYLDGWLEAVVPDAVGSVNTVDNYRWAVNKHLAPGLGDRRLAQLTPREVAGFLHERQDRGLSHNSLMRLRSVLIAALSHAVLEGLVSRNVAALVRTPRGERPEGRSLSLGQAQALLTACKGERLEALFKTMLMLGLRPGEALGLAWDDVDLAGRRMSIRRSLKRERGVLRLGETKTRRSVRTLQLPGPLVQALRTQKRRQAKERLAAGPDWEDLDLVFPTVRGTPIDPSNLRREFSRMTTKAGLGHWHPHELRHSAASLLSAAGVPIEVVADILGHSTTRMVERVYRHRVRASVDGAVAPMESMFGSPNPGSS